MTFHFPREHSDMKGLLARYFIDINIDQYTEISFNILEWFNDFLDKNPKFQKYVWNTNNVLVCNNMKNYFFAQGKCEN